MTDTAEVTDLVHRNEPVASPHSGRFGKGIYSAGIVFAIGILISAVLLFYEVILRYVFNSPTTWVHETVVFLNASAFIYGGLYAAAIDKHIRVVLFYERLKPGMHRVFDIGISLSCLIASLFFAWAAWQSVKRAAWTPQGEFRLETSGSAWNPVYPGLMKIFLFVILILLAVQFAIIAINYVRARGED